jgi:hypothetical protein
LPALAVLFFVDPLFAQDTHILNATTTTEEVDVRAVTFLATVVDEKGSIVHGLTSSDFVIEDAGARIDAAVRSLEGEPVTIGLAIDLISFTARPGLKFRILARDHPRRSGSARDGAWRSGVLRAVSADDASRSHGRCHHSGVSPR